MSKPDHKKRMKEIKRRMRFIDERHKKFIEETKLQVVSEKDAHHAQPATVEKYFKNDVTSFKIKKHDRFWLLINIARCFVHSFLYDYRTYESLLEYFGSI